MAHHSHNFIETYQGLVAFGFDRETDENTIIYYLQKFSDDNLMKNIIKRLSDDELESIFNIISGLLKKHLTEDEYHSQFLKNSHHH